MDAKVPGPKRRDDAPPLLNAAIEAMNLAKEATSMTPAKAVFGAIGVILAMKRVVIFLVYRLANEFGLACADVCKALGRGMDGRQFHNHLLQGLTELIQLAT